MDMFTFIATLSYIVRSAVLVAVVLLVVLFVLAWLVRTRRINPFHPLARSIARLSNPLLAPIERRIVRAGGLPSHAPWWGIAGAIILGVLIVSVFNFLVGTIASMIFAASSGPRGLFVVLVRLTFDVLQAAVIVVVIVSWLPISPSSPWVRWAFSLAEPILRPLRQIVPRLGMFDITPIVAYFALSILEWAFLRL
jgi:YggT family protein